MKRHLPHLSISSLTVVIIASSTEKKNKLNYSKYNAYRGLLSVRVVIKRLKDHQDLKVAWGRFRLGVLELIIFKFQFFNDGTIIGSALNFLSAV